MNKIYIIELTKLKGSHYSYDELSNQYDNIIDLINDNGKSKTKRICLRGDYCQLLSGIIFNKLGYSYNDFS